MKVSACPHCGATRIVTSQVPKDVVVVMPCPNCHDLVVMFRAKVIALSRRIIEQGSFEEKKAHISEVIAEFLDPSLFVMPSEMPDDGELPLPLDDEPDDSDADLQIAPISQGEVDEFLRVGLKQIDDFEYFKKNIG